MYAPGFRFALTDADLPGCNIAVFQRTGPKIVTKLCGNLPVFFTLNVTAPGFNFAGTPLILNSLSDTDTVCALRDADTAIGNAASTTTATMPAPTSHLFIFCLPRVDVVPSVRMRGANGSERTAGEQPRAPVHALRRRGEDRDARARPRRIVPAQDCGSPAHLVDLDRPDCIRAMVVGQPHQVALARTRRREAACLECD